MFETHIGPHNKDGQMDRMDPGTFSVFRHGGNSQSLSARSRLDWRHDNLIEESKGRSAVNEQAGLSCDIARRRYPRC